MSSSYVVILCTCPDASCAQTLARGLVKSHLVACASILPGITSIYTWQGKLESSNECQLLAKTETKLFFAAEAFIKQNHPYELPEVLAVPVTLGSKDYLDWISSCVGIPQGS